MHRNRSWRGRFERTAALALSLWVNAAICWVIWQLAHETTSLEFALAGGVIVTAIGKISDRARAVRFASRRTRVWVLPVRDGRLDRPDDPDGGGTAPGSRLGLPGNGDQRGDGR